MSFSANLKFKDRCSVVTRNWSPDCILWCPWQSGRTRLVIFCGIKRRVARRSSRKSSRKTVSRRNTSRRRTQRGGGLKDRFAIALVNASVNKYISTEDYYKRNEKEKFNPRIEPDEFNTRIKKGKADNKKEQVYKMEAYNSFITHATNIIEITGKDENNGDIRKILDNLTTEKGRNKLKYEDYVYEYPLHKNVRSLIIQAENFIEKTWFLYDPSADTATKQLINMLKT